MNPIISYLYESRDELKKVTWPKRDALIRLTLVVLGISIITATYLGILDSLLSRLVTLVISLKK
jgi:preprotein translocase subunit SecE